MVTKIQQHTKSSSSPLEYNEKKCREGKAELVHTRNIADDSLRGVEKALLSLEENPAISERTRKLGLHLTVNPGKDDGMEEALTMSYIDDLMSAIGYGAQPYAVYRHHDIDRIHYHIVSVRANRNGKIIRDTFSRRRVMRIQQDLSRKYGFTVGLKNGNGDRILPAPQPVKRGMTDVVSQLKANIMEAMCYGHNSDEEFRAILRRFGIDMKRGTRKGKNGKEHRYVSFRAFDEKGKYMCRPVKAKKLLGMPFDEYYAKSRRRRQTFPIRGEISETPILIKMAYDNSCDLADFRQRLAKGGISICFFMADGAFAERLQDVQRIVFVNSRRKECAACTECGLSVTQIIGLAKNPRQKAEEKPVIAQTQSKGI